MEFVKPAYANETLNISKLYNPASNIKGNNLSSLLTGGGFNLLNLVFFAVGIYFFANLVIAGWNYMLSSGDTKKIAAATTQIINCFIGLIMAVTAFLVVRIVTSILNSGTPLI